MARSQQATKPPPVAFDRPTLASIKTSGSGLPSRLVLHAVEGWGKTSLAAQIPGVVFIETKGETGLETLIDSKQLLETPHFDEV